MRRRLAVIGLVIVVTGLAVPMSAGAVGTGGSSPFAMSPSFKKGQKISSYFQLNMRAGQTKTEQVSLSDTGRNAELLKLGASFGVTAPNTGAAYKGAYAPCKQTACWIRDLPAEVQLRAGETKKVAFKVVVPSGTPNKQYLAGITAQPAHNGGSVVVGKKGSATARAIIINQITVGVAVTIGPLSSLRSALAIRGAHAVAIGKTPRLLVEVHNVGQRFTSATGSAVCTDQGHQHSYSVLANTILPGDSAVISVNALGLPALSKSRCSITLPFGTSSAHWVGTVKVPSLKVAKVVHNHKGQYTAVPDPSFPVWAVAVMAGGGGLLLALLITFLVFMKRYRRQLRSVVPADS
jgi:hypothetical protein